MQPLKLFKNHRRMSLKVRVFTYCLDFADIQTASIIEDFYLKNALWMYCAELSCQTKRHRHCHEQSSSFWVFLKFMQFNNMPPHKHEHLVSVFLKTFRFPGIAKDLQINWKNLNVHNIETRTRLNSFHQFFPRQNQETLLNTKLSLFRAYEYISYLFPTFLKLAEKWQ